LSSLQGPLKLLGSPTAALAAAKARLTSSNSSATASSLAKENAALKARLAKVEEAAAEALGELQDAQDELDAHKEARQAAEQQVRCQQNLFEHCAVAVL
jgi:predicted  nucleic acid-binding Zn-ribbon protein